MRGIKPKLSISKLSIFACTLSMRKKKEMLANLNKVAQRTVKDSFWVSMKARKDA